MINKILNGKVLVLKMINLNNKKTCKIFFSILVIIFVSSVSFKTISSENKIIFKINDKAFTTYDYELRVRYLEFVGNNSNLDKQIIIDDFISANIFNEYYKKIKNKDKIENKVIKIFENIKAENKKNKKEYNYELNIENILFNIKIDYIRKIILENLLNSQINNLDISNDEIDILYKFDIKYINFFSKNSEEIINKIYNIKNINITKTKSFLNENNIQYFVKEDEIINIDKIDKRIRSKILKNISFFILENQKKITIIFINKSFETLEGLTAKLYSVKSKSKIDDELLKCNNLLNNNFNLISKEYKFKDLNNELKTKLVNINDYVNFYNNDENNYVILCDIKFDEEILNNNNLNKLIINNVTKIEKKFLSKYSKIYNLNLINE